MQGFNLTWFVPDPAQHSIAGSRMHAIYAISWADVEGTVQYPLIWDDDNNHTVSAFDVTEYYLQAASIEKSAMLHLHRDLATRTNAVS